MRSVVVASVAAVARPQTREFGAHLTTGRFVVGEIGDLHKIECRAARRTLVLHVDEVDVRVGARLATAPISRIARHVERPPVDLLRRQVRARDQGA